MESLTAYIKEAKRETRRARQEPPTPESLVRRHLALPVVLATEIARKANLHRQWLPDLIAAGNVALVEASKKYDPSKGTFRAYAKPRVAGAILSALTMMMSGGTLGPGTRQKYHTYLSAVRRVEQDGREATLEEVAKEAGLRVDTVRALQQLTEGVISLDGLVNNPGGDDTIPLGELQPDPSPGPEEQALDALEAQQRREELARAVESLPERSRLAICLTTGFQGMERATLGDVLAVYMSYTRQHRARTKLQKVFREGKANARRLGFEPEDARGVPRGSGPISAAASLGRPSPDFRRHRAEDIWRLLADRFREAAPVDADAHL